MRRPDANFSCVHTDDGSRMVACPPFGTHTADTLRDREMKAFER